MVLYAKFGHGSQFSGAKKQFILPLHGLQGIRFIVMKENSGVFFETPCILRNFNGFQEISEYFKIFKWIVMEFQGF